MLENFSNIENSIDKSVVSQGLSADEQKNIILQVIVDGYLKKSGREPMEVTLNSKGLESRPGLLYGYHIEMLQIMIQEDLKLLGLDLPTEVSKAGEEFIVGKLTAFETKIVLNFADSVIGILDVVRERQLKRAQEGQ